MVCEIGKSAGSFCSNTLAAVAKLLRERVVRVKLCVLCACVSYYVPATGGNGVITGVIANHCDRGDMVKRNRQECGLVLQQHIGGGGKLLCECVVRVRFHIIGEVTGGAVREQAD